VLWGEAVYWGGIGGASATLLWGFDLDLALLLLAAWAA